MKEPRKLTAINGEPRWQGESGKTFKTYNEAVADTCSTVDLDPKAPDLPVPQVTAVAGWALAYLAIGIGGSLIVLGLSNGDIPTKNAVTGAAFLIGGWWAIGGLFASATAFASVHQGRLVDWEERSIKAWKGYLRWTLKAALWIVGFVITYWLISSLFAGLSKGTIVIAVLLLAILAVLVLKRS